MITRWLPHLCLGSLLAVGLACRKDPNQTKLTYMPDMMDAPVAKPQRDYLDPPPDSVAMDAILYPQDAEEAGRVLRNPLAHHPDQEKLRRHGEYLYNQGCITCHGADAKGKGSITDVYAPPPDLTTGDYLTKPDGFFFYRISKGSAIMPAQGDKYFPKERWEIVLFLRELQAKVQSKG